MDLPSIRRDLAQRAAALIAEGLDDYHQAKLKAAKSLNVTDKQSLPDNHEIEAALREHLALFAGGFAGNTQPEALAALRRAALRAMRWLQIEAKAIAKDDEPAFAPWLSLALDAASVQTDLVEHKMLDRMTVGEAVGQHVAGDFRIHADHRITADSTKLMHADHRAERHVIFDHHMTRNLSRIRNNVVIAQNAIVRDVNIRRNKIVRTDFRDFTLARGAVQRRKFPNCV